MAEPHPALPPYVYPDRIPSEYESSKNGSIWRVSGPTYTDGAGWNWEMSFVQDLVPGDVWVPIYMLHSVPIAKIVERSRELRS